MRIPMAILADAANVSQEGKLNVLGTFDAIRARSFPARHLSMVFVFRLQADWEDSGETYPISVRLVDMDGRKLFESEGRIEVPEIAPGEYQSVNQIMNLVGVEFPSPGRYKFEVRAGDAPVHETRFSLIDVGE